MLDINSYNFTEEQLIELKKALPFIEQLSFKKGEFIVKEGEIENYYYFIEEGIVRYWTIRNNKEVTLDFIFSNEFCASFESLILQQPSKINEQAVTNISAIRISKENMDKVMNESIVLLNLKNKILEQFLIHKFQREFQLLCDSPDDRYLSLTDKHPQLLNVISLKHIASYLGVTPETISRIRNRTLKR